MFTKMSKLAAGLAVVGGMTFQSPGCVDKLVEEGLRALDEELGSFEGYEDEGWEEEGYWEEECCWEDDWGMY